MQTEAINAFMITIITERTEAESLWETNSTWVRQCLNCACSSAKGRYRRWTCKYLYWVAPAIRKFMVKSSSSSQQLVPGDLQSWIAQLKLMKCVRLEQCVSWSCMVSGRAQRCKRQTTWSQCLKRGKHFGFLPVFFYLLMFLLGSFLLSYSYSQFLGLVPYDLRFIQSVPFCVPSLCQSCLALYVSTVYSPVLSSCLPLCHVNPIPLFHLDGSCCFRAACGSGGRADHYWMNGTYSQTRSSLNAHLNRKAPYKQKDTQ